MTDCRSPRLVHDSVFLHAESRGGAVAVEDGDRNLTYAELASRSLRLAATLSHLGLERGEPVVFVMENGADACVAMCGVLRADGCYVPVPPSWPALRAGLVIGQVRPRVVITQEKHRDHVAHILAAEPEIAVSAVIVVDADKSVAMAGATDVVIPRDFASEEECPSQRNIPEDLAYILFTSGTTGTPKGVMVRHRNVMNFLNWATYQFDLGPDDRISNHSSLSFDLSVFDVWGAFLVGAASVPLTAATDKMLPGLFVHDRQISVWFSVPGVISMMRRARQLKAGTFPRLRHAIFCGEAMTNDDARAWISANPDIQLTNLYGPTEATVACSVFNVSLGSLLDSRPVPIGSPIDGNELVVLDAADEISPAGVVGRLAICGEQIAAGYWRQPELTASVFRPNPLKPDIGTVLYETGDLAFTDDAGVFHFMGRADSQIKFMGYRIELTEIEFVLSDCPGILEASVVLIDGAMPEIVGAITVEVGESLSDEEIFAYCELRLPAYMIPRRFARLTDMPRNINGKIDRSAVGKIIGQQE